MANRSGMAAVYGALTLDVTRDIVVNDAVVEVDAWVEGTAHVDFPIYAFIPIEGVTAKMRVDVIFTPVEAASGNYAPIAETVDGGVKIFAVEYPDNGFTIPTIIVWK